jgi:hypothetical protein
MRYICLVAILALFVKLRDRMQLATGSRMRVPLHEKTDAT